MKKIILFWLIQIGFALSVKAQCSDVQFVYSKSSDPASVIHRRFSLQRHPSQKCALSVQFAKFAISAEGQVVDIGFSYGLDSLNKQGLRTAIEASAGCWVPAVQDGKKVKSKPFLIMILYDFTGSCGPTQVSASEEAKVRRAKERAAMLKAGYKFAEPLKNMLQFDDGTRLDQLNCVFLRPIYSWSMH